MTKSRLRAILIGGTIIPAAIWGCRAAISSAFSIFDLCGNTVIEEAMSPDSTMRAVVFERDCGATTDFSTQVSVLPRRAKLPDEAGNVFVAGTRGTVPGEGGGPEAHVEWEGPDKLTVRYNRNGEVFRKEDRIGKIGIGYEGLKPARPEK